MGTIVLTSSDWIALVACVGTFIALIPAFTQMVHTREMKKIAEQAAKANNENAAPATTPESEERRPLNGFGRALVLTAYALVIGVIEIVLFSTVASIYGVEVNINTMPTNWLVIFYALALVPGLMLFMAFAYLTTMFDD